ncbi:MAG TPA: Smr/MutS family protein [Gemmatimonadales bacterium]|nr:Smr/MutS family protein [Gemmatimonadales bacterium]
MPKRRRRPKHPRFDPDLGLQRVPLAGQLDLHGLTVPEAESAVRGFIDRSRRRQPGAVVLIITGKGTGSAAGPVLRPAIQALLKTRLSGYVEEWALDDSEGAFRVRVR